MLLFLVFLLYLIIYSFAQSLLQASFEHFDPFCRALNVMSESWSRLHRQNSVLNFVDAAFVTTEVNGGGAGVADVNPTAAKASSAAKNQKAKGKEPSSKVGGDEKRSKTATKRNASSEEGYLEPSEADFPELPRLMPRAAHHADPESNGDSRRHGPPAMPSHIDRSFLLQGGTGTQTSEADAENDGKGELEVELEDVSENVLETECEDDELLDDNVVFQSAFLRAYPSNEAFTTERNEWTSPTSGLLYPSSHANSSSRLDGLLYQDQRSTPSNREPYAPTNNSAGFGLDLGLDLDLDLSRLVQDNHHDQQHEHQGLDSLLQQSATSTHPQSHSGSQDKLSSLFGADSVLGEFWNDAPSLPALPQPHASFGHAFSTNFDPLGTNLGLNAGFGGLNTSSVGGGLGAGADSWSFGQLSAPHLRALPPQSAPLLAAQPAYYFPPDSISASTGAVGSGGAAGWSPPGLNPHTLLPPPPPLLQTQLGLSNVATASVSGVAGAPPPGLQPQHQQQQQQQQQQQ